MIDEWCRETSVKNGEISVGWVRENWKLWGFLRLNYGRDDAVGEEKGDAEIGKWERTRGSGIRTLSVVRWKMLDVGII